MATASLSATGTSLNPVADFRGSRRVVPGSSVLVAWVFLGWLGCSMAAATAPAVSWVGAPESDLDIPDRIRPFEGGWWSIADPRDYGFDPDDLDDVIDRMGRMDGVYSVLVVRDHHLIAERYFREGTRTKAHNLKSSSKSIISALIGILVDEGKLTLEQSVVELLGVRGLPADRAAITVRDLLRMASGLTSTSYESYSAWVASSDWVRAALALPLLFEPGTHYRYSTGNTHLLSAVVRQASGESTRAFAEQRLFGPLGIRVFGWETDPQGTHIGGNNLALLPRDMAKFGELYLREGAWNGEQIVPAEWVAKSTKVEIFAENETYGDYGYLWFVPREEENRGDFIAVGYGGQYIYVSPRVDTVVVVTSTLESKGRGWERELFSLLQGELLHGQGIETTLLNPITERPGIPSTGAPGVVGKPEKVLTELTELTESAKTVVAQAESRTEEPPQELVRELAAEREANRTNEALLKALHQDQAEWQETNERLTRRVAEVQSANRTLETTVRDQQSTIDNLRRRETLHLADAEQAAQTVAEEKAAAAVRRAELEDQLSQAAALTVRQADLLESRALELERSKAERQRLQRQAETRLQHQKDSGESEQQRLQQAFLVERSELESQLATEQSRADQALRELERERDLARAAVRQQALIEEERGGALLRAREAEEALALRGQRLAALLEEVEALQQASTASNREAVKQSRKIAVLQDEAKTLRTDVTASQRDLTAVRGELYISQTRNRDLVERLAKQRAEKAREIAVLEAANAGFEQRLRAAESASKTLEGDASATKLGLERRIAVLERSLARSDEELETARRAVTESAGVGAERETEIADLRGRLKDRESRIATYTAQEELLRLNLGAARQRNDQLADSLEEAQASLTALTEENASLVKAAQVAEVERSAYSGRLRQLELSLEEQRENNLVQSQSLSAAKTDLERYRMALREREGDVARFDQQREQEQLDLLERLEQREQSIRRLREEVAASQAKAQPAREMAGLQRSYEQLLSESEMLARRSGEQADKMQALERQVSSRQRSDFERRLRDLIAEVDRLSRDQRVGAVVRKDLQRLRTAMVELGRVELGRVELGRRR